MSVDKTKEIRNIRKTSEKNQTTVNKASVKMNSERNILSIGMIIISIGIIIILTSIILNVCYHPAPDLYLKNKLKDILDQLLMCAGTTLITIGAGTALYSYFDFVNYVQNKIKDVIIDYNFTDHISDEQKKSLARRLEKELLHQNTENNLYDFVQEEVLSLARQAYYEEFTLDVSCHKVGNEIHKTIYKDYIINCESQKDFDIARNNEFGVKCKTSCTNALEANIKLTINSIEFTDADYSITESATNDEVYGKRCKYTLNDSAKKRIENTRSDNWDYKYNVQSEMLSIVKDDDMSFSFRLYYPCKNTTFLFTYNPDEFEVMEDVFVFKDFDNNENNQKKPIITRHNKGSILVKIDNWILPGDGITFVLSPPTPSNSSDNIINQNNEMGQHSQTA
ncbi:MAG: hypothetical protein NC416_06740 [Eubacterium sp.]|nr:hypothetical protein [Eubacterium sp.]